MSCSNCMLNQNGMKHLEIVRNALFGKFIEFISLLFNGHDEKNLQPSTCDQNRQINCVSD